MQYTDFGDKMMKLFDTMLDTELNLKNNNKINKNKNKFQRAPHLAFLWDENYSLRSSLTLFPCIR
jgi:hypothetical protein